MKKTETTKAPTFSNDKNSINSIHIQMIGTFLHGTQFTADELNERYGITNSLEIINELYNIVDEVQGTDPKQYQFSSKMPTGWEQ